MFGRGAVADPGMVEMYGSVAMVQAAWTLMAYTIMPLGAAASLGGHSKGQANWGSRAFLNMMEQAPVFLSSLWMCAVFVSADVAATLGWAYLALRALYPLIWLFIGGEAGCPIPIIFVSTFPQYGIVTYMALATLLKCDSGDDLSEYFNGSPLLGSLACGAVIYLAVMYMYMPLAGVIGKKFFKTK